MPSTYLAAILLAVTILYHTPLSAQVVTEMKKATSKKRAPVDSMSWKRTGVLLLNVNQAAQTAWGGGGENFQVGVNLLFNKAIHHRSGKYFFDAYLDLEAGLVKSSSIKKFRKTSDRCDLTAEFEHSIGKKGHYYYGFLANFNSQLFSGNDYLVDNYPRISSFLSPGKLLLSFGLDYKDTDSTHYFSLFVSPATIRWVIKRDKAFFNSKRFGVDSARKVYVEIGSYLSIHYTKSFSKTLNYTGRLDLFSNYKKDPQQVDLFMNNLLTFAISKSFAGSIIVDLLYDYDIKNKLQVQEITGLGLRLRL